MVEPSKEGFFSGSIFNGFHANKVFIECLEMQIEFENKSSNTLTLIRNKNGRSRVTKEPNNTTLAPGEKHIFRVIKESMAVMGPFVIAHWKVNKSPFTHVCYNVSNSINGSPEGVVEVLKGSCADEFAWNFIQDTHRKPTFVESSDGKLKAEFERKNEDSIIWHITLVD